MLRTLIRPLLLVSSARLCCSLIAPARSQLPSRPSPSKPRPTPLSEGPSVLDGSRLVDMARVGAAAVSPDGTRACFDVRQYDWDEKIFDAQLWIADLAAAAVMSDAQV